MINLVLYIIVRRNMIKYSKIRKSVCFILMLISIKETLRFEHICNGIRGTCKFISAHSALVLVNLVESILALHRHW